MKTPSFIRSSASTRFPLVRLWTLIVPVLWLSGCGGDSDDYRSIRSERQRQVQNQSNRDYLGETFTLFQGFVDLNEEKAERQIAYQLNRWREARSIQASEKPPEILKTISDLYSTERFTELVQKEAFAASDVNYLRDCYLFRQVVRWVDTERCDDLLLQDWMAEQEKELGVDTADQLRTAARLFEWTIRNISYEPKTAAEFPESPEFPLGMVFEGAGYRQTDYQTLWRGTGDSLQRAGVFINLCRQASLSAFVLSIQSTDTGELNPWCVGVQIGKEIYLFETELGMFVPGPDQVGIATLTQARTDESVLRRLNVIGFFDYPFSKKDVQQCVALLNVKPEAVTDRMRLLESGLTGDRRMIVHVDADKVASQIDAIPGIAGVRLWRMPLLAEVYKAEMAKVVRDKPEYFWYQARWSMMDSDVESSQDLSRARWRHLHGNFDDDQEENVKGARTLYLGQRAPEFELEKLKYDVDLQKKYFRRELGVSREEYDQQIQYVRGTIQMQKRTATYWLSLVQYEDQLYSDAKNWLSKRALDEKQRSFWEPAARYNLARTSERLGEIDKAIEIYKSEKSQEHGNRIRARLLGRMK